MLRTDRNNNLAAGKHIWLRYCIKLKPLGIIKLRFGLELFLPIKGHTRLSSRLVNDQLRIAPTTMRLRVEFQSYCLP